MIKNILKVNTEKIKELINVDIEKENLIKIKRGLEKLIKYFGEKNLKNFYMNSWIACSVGGTIISFVGSLILIYTKSIVTTSLITGGGVIIAGVIGFFVWKYLENDAKKKY